MHLRDSTDATRWRTFNDGTVSDIPREEIFGALGETHTLPFQRFRLANNTRCSDLSGGATPIMLLWALQDSSKPSVIKSATGQLKGDLKRGFQMTGGQVRLYFLSLSLRIITFIDRSFSLSMSFCLPITEDLKRIFTSRPKRRS